MLRTILACTSSALLTCAAATSAEERPETITWVRDMSYTPEQYRDIVGPITHDSTPVLDRLVKEGTLESWGMLYSLTRDDQSPSQSVWITARGWAQIDAMFEALSADHTAFGGSGPITIRDQIFRNVVMPPKPDAPTKRPRYIQCWLYKVRWGNEQEAIQLYRDYALPVYTKLLADGAIVDAGLGVSEVPGDMSWTHISWVKTADLASLDKVHRAFVETNQSRSEDEQAAFHKKMTDTFDMDAHRSRILKISYLGGQTDSESP